MVNQEDVSCDRRDIPDLEDDSSSEEDIDIMKLTTDFSEPRSSDAVHSTDSPDSDNSECFLNCPSFSVLEPKTKNKKKKKKKRRKKKVEMYATAPPFDTSKYDKEEISNYVTSKIKDSEFYVPYLAFFNQRFLLSSAFDNSANLQSNVQNAMEVLAINGNLQGMKELYAKFPSCTEPMAPFLLQVSTSRWDPRMFSFSLSKVVKQREKGEDSSSILYFEDFQIPESFKSPEYLKETLGYFKRYQVHVNTADEHPSLLFFLISNAPHVPPHLKTNFNTILHHYKLECQQKQISHQGLFDIWRVILQNDLKNELDNCMFLSEAVLTEIILELKRVTYKVDFEPPLSCIIHLLVQPWTSSNGRILVDLVTIILAVESLKVVIPSIPKYVFQEYALSIIDQATMLPSAEFIRVFSYLYDNALLEKLDASQLNNYPLTMLARGGFVDSMKKLLDLGCSLAVVDEEGYSPLLRAVQQCDIVTTGWLMEQSSCDVTYMNPKTLESLISMACDTDDEQFLRSLLKNLWQQSQQMKQPIIRNLVEMISPPVKQANLRKCIQSYVKKEDQKFPENSSQGKRERKKNRKKNRKKVISYTDAVPTQANKAKRRSMNQKLEEIINVIEMKLHELESAGIFQKITKEHKKQCDETNTSTREDKHISKKIIKDNTDETLTDIKEQGGKDEQAVRVSEKKEPMMSNDSDKQLLLKASYPLQQKSGTVSEEIFAETTWEIVLTDKAKRQWEALDTQDRKAVGKTLLKLSEGYRSISVSKKLTGVPTTLKLYESKFSKGGRILWEEAVDFSYRYKRAFYTDIIRVWFIVSQHDKVASYIEKCVKSHRIGLSGRVTRNMVPNGQKSTGISARSAVVEPRLYQECNEIRETEATSSSVIPVFPPASAQSRSSSIEKFYSLSDKMLRNILVHSENEETTCVSSDFQFPFQVSEVEYEVIKQSSTNCQSTILLGRSGTGKTTCALYKLWFEFQAYWEISDPATPRYPSQDGRSYSHLHQVFVTANPVLRAEIRRIFHSLKVGNLSHLPFDIGFSSEDVTLPSSLQDVDYRYFPLFLTSRQWILMLDATLKRPFFSRYPDASLREKKFENYQNNESRSILSSLHILVSAESDSQQHDEDSEGFLPHIEIDYEYFVCVIWPDIKPSRCPHHPSLVFTEIYSFIKGSVESLQSKTGYLTREEYKNLGRKRANTFSDESERNEIYDIFMEFEKYKKNHRWEVQLFDWMDVVHHCYRQLCIHPYCGVPIHSLVHDEVQDATQAELALYFLVCSPNALFFTGDTCQTIARGVGFRFSDLRSLFHYKHQLDNQTIVPSVTHLIRNYRSHAGITNLAGAVVELMKFFHPHSFDSELPRDQGILQGNPPLLLASPKLENLYYLLFGHQRVNGGDKIEFGADQVIIVKNQNAKEKLPPVLRKEALCLTVFESKGLEFNDVLLFNFFSDSNADHQWRAVNEYNDQYYVNSSKDTVQCEELTHISNPTLIQTNNTKILASELKFLYTAITRARENIWIYDSNEKVRKPMFSYFERRGVAVLVKGDAMKREVKAVKSTPKEWKLRGDNLMEKKLYSLAAQCFEKSGNKILEDRCKAFALAEEGFGERDPMERKIKYLKAASLFLQSDIYDEAATCLYEAGYYAHSAQLFNYLGNAEAALICSAKATNKEFPNFLGNKKG